MSKMNITKKHKKQFEALRDGRFNNFALFSCFIDGEPGCAIVAVNAQPDEEVLIAPLFVSVTPKMKLTDHEGKNA